MQQNVEKLGVKSCSLAVKLWQMQQSWPISSLLSSYQQISQCLTLMAVDAAAPLCVASALIHINLPLLLVGVHHIFGQHNLACTEERMETTKTLCVQQVAHSAQQ